MASSNFSTIINGFSVGHENNTIFVYHISLPTVMLVANVNDLHVSMSNFIMDFTMMINFIITPINAENLHNFFEAFLRINQINAILMESGQQ